MKIPTRPLDADRAKKPPGRVNGQAVDTKKRTELMNLKFDKLIVWATMGGIWLLVVTLFNKDITTNGPIGSAIAVTAGFAAAYFSKPMIARFARYQLILIIVLVWSVTIYLMSH